MTLDIYRKMILVIAFLPAVSATGLVSISNTASASIDYSGTAGGEPFKVLVTVVGVKGHFGEDIKVIVAYKSETYHQT